MGTVYALIVQLMVDRFVCHGNVSIGKFPDKLRGSEISI